MPSYVFTLRCPDTAGIVHAAAQGVLDCSGSIVEQAQFSDADSGLFCQRTVFETAEADVERVRDAVGSRLARFDPVLTLRPTSQRRRVLLMVSRYDHCLTDLLYRHAIGELPVDIPLVVSNHEDCRALVEGRGIPYVVLPVTPETKPAQEQALLDLIAEHRVELVVLARYMQVLSDGLCSRLAGRAINIHHSFLPGFKGARPYHQAHERGVKLIGATAHFVTGELDEGPIIEQGVERVTHADTAEDLVAIGRDVERTVLARAVRLWAEDRVVLTGHRTVVLP